MPVSKGAGRAVSCADCYFHQELLCALPGDRVCPTFRATVGRKPAQPLQAQLMPLPTHAQLEDAIMPAPQVMPAPIRVATVQHPAPHGAVNEAVPFSESAQEARFTIRGAREDEFGDLSEDSMHQQSRPVGEPHEQARPLPSREPELMPVRVAAARVDFDNELVVPAHMHTPQAAGTPTPQRPRHDRVALRGVSASRSHRIAERIAARYPNSSPIDA